MTLRGHWLFVAGCVLVAIGVLLHLPMFLMGAAMDYRLAGMPADPAMYWGMALILVGTALAARGLLPPRAGAEAPDLAVEPPDDLALRPAHWGLLFALAAALVIDVMKPASLGFTLAEMSEEYGLPRSTVALLPFSALSGTVLGSLVWGALADRYGRRATILLSAVMFVGTSICGTMPSFAWNLAMCLMMGMAAGGLLPVAYALLAEMMPRRHRGWSMVLVGGLGASGGYAAASLIAALFQPEYGWRVLWLANLPTGLMLIALGPLIPESAKFLMARGRGAEAAAVLARFGARVRPASATLAEPLLAEGPSASGGWRMIFLALTVTGLAWGWANFGVLLWLPAELSATGAAAGKVGGLLAKSALIAVPTTLVAALLYHRWSASGTLALAVAIMLAGLAMLVEVDLAHDDPVPAVAVLLVGVNAIIAVILPLAAELVPQDMRGRGTGWVAACTKAGGLLAQGFGLLGLVLSVRSATGAVLVPTALAALLLVGIGWRAQRTSPASV